MNQAETPIPTLQARENGKHMWNSKEGIIFMRT